jgi:group I intron endonuclease
MYGEENFKFVVLRECERNRLLQEEQIDLDKFYGTPECYNLSPNAFRPNLGVPRTEEVKRKISEAQRGKPRFTDEQKEHLSVVHRGKTHSNETRLKMMGRLSSKQNIKRAIMHNTGRPLSTEHCNHIGEGKRSALKIYSDEERGRIRDGVHRAFLEGRHRKNKIPKTDAKTIVESYLSGVTNKRQLAIEYGVTPGSMAAFLKRNGA